MTRDELYPVIDRVLHAKQYEYSNAGSFWIDQSDGDVQLRIHPLTEALCDAIVARLAGGGVVIGDELHEAINAVIIDQTWVTYERVGQDAVVAGSGLAADAILALPEMQAMLAEIVRLRAAGDAMAKALDALCHSYCGSDDDADLVDAWQEARRG